jgi:hypothetical protein
MLKSILNLLKSTLIWAFIVFISLVITSIICYFTGSFWYTPLFLPIVILASFIYGLIKDNKRYNSVLLKNELEQEEQRKKNNLLKSRINEYLLRALAIMDSTASWYNNEDEANKELVTSLKSQGLSDVVYQYRLPNGRTADAKVADILIEGKLSPNNVSEVDRLIGQLGDYTQYSEQLNIVIYGYFDSDARKRVENEILSRYSGRVFLSYLDSPNRRRVRSIS